MKFSIKDFFSKCDQIRRNLQIWSHLLKKFLMENLIFCAVFITIYQQRCQKMNSGFAGRAVILKLLFTYINL